MDSVRKQGLMGGLRGEGMKVARKWYQFQAVDRKVEEPEPELFERMLKLERELHSLVLEVADLTDFTHRMAKRRYTENYDAVVPRGATAKREQDVFTKPKPIAQMNREEKLELMRKVRGG